MEISTISLNTSFSRVVIPLFRSYRKNMMRLPEHWPRKRMRCNPFIQVLSEKFGRGDRRQRRPGVSVVIPLFRSYRKNIQVLSEKFGDKAGCNPFIQVLSEKWPCVGADRVLGSQGCNPFIQVLSEKYKGCRGGMAHPSRVVIPLFRSYRKNLQMLADFPANIQVVIPLFRSYRKNSGKPS